MPMTHQTHCIKTSGKQKLMVADTSDSTKFLIVHIRKTSKEESDDEEESNEVSDKECDPEDNLQAGSPGAPSSDPTQQFTLKVGQWVVVNYDGLKFPGEVTTCGENDAEVSVMHRSGNAWRWPTNPDKIFYQHQNFLRQINPPKASGNRGQFTFDDIIQ